MILNAAKQQKITHVSDAWLAVFCYDREEIVGRSHKFLQGPGTDHPNFKKLISAANKGKDCGAPFVMYKKDGSCVVSYVQARIIASEESEHIVLKFSTSQTMKTTNIPSEDVPWVWLSTDSRLSIIRSSSALSDLTGFNMSSITSRSLRVLLGGFFTIDFENIFCISINC